MRNLFREAALKPVRARFRMEGSGPAACGWAVNSNCNILQTAVFILHCIISFFYNDNLTGSCVRLCKVDVFKAVLGDCHACDADISFSGLYRIDDR